MSDLNFDLLTIFAFALAIVMSVVAGRHRATIARLRDDLHATKSKLFLVRLKKANASTAQPVVIVDKDGVPSDALAALDASIAKLVAQSIYTPSAAETPLGDRS